MFGISTTPDGAIIIPVCDFDGNLLYNKYRRSPLSNEGPKYLYDKGGKIALYGAQMAKDAKTVLITEGEMDCLVAWSCNIPAVTSTSGAMSFQDSWISFFDDKEVILCFDNDPAGGEGMARTLEILPHAKVMFLPDVPNLKDISDYASMGNSLVDLMRTAKHFDSIEAIIEDRSKCLATYDSVYFHDACIKRMKEQQKPAPKTGKKDLTNGTDIEKARAFPISELIDFKNDKARCPFHNEKTPSLQYYPADNHCYCFGGCGRAYDAIDVYMKINNCGFKQAVAKLK